VRPGPRPPHRRRSGARLATLGACVAVTVALLGACTPAPDTGASGDGTALEGTSGDTGATRPTPAGWDACRGGLECTTLEVPADWNDPDGPTISLAVARRPASSGAPRGVILANPGGPGGSGVDWLAGAGDLAGLGVDFDVVSWDPRGVGASTQIDCGGLGGPAGTDIHRLPTTGPAADDTAAAVAEFADACAAGSPALVDHLGTDQGVADMEAIRVATGADRLDLVGFSYGTYLALAYARAYPEGVRTIVLDAPVDPADRLEDLLVAQATAMEAWLDDVLADDPTRWDRAAARTDPTTLAFAAIAASYDPASPGPLPAALASAAEGDDAAVRTLADAYFDAASFTAYIGTLCADLDRPATAAEQAAMARRLAAIAPRLGAAIAGEVAACVAWPVASGRRWTPSVPPGVPVLVIAGTGDLATPLALAESVDAALGTSTLVVRQGDGHVSLRRSPCVADLVERLLADGTLPPDPTTCPT